MNKMFERGITVRNQAVLQRGVNDSGEAMKLLVKRLGHVHVHPYYVYVHDLVKGVEDLRTTVQTALDIERFVRGTTAGFNTPTFVVDAPGGGGKRDAHSYEHYDRRSGISVYAAPSVKPGQYFLYFDPVDTLEQEYQRRWSNPAEADAMVADALAVAKARLR
jgi:lysine 2,3-aminomutase